MARVWALETTYHTLADLVVCASFFFFFAESYIGFWSPLLTTTSSPGRFSRGCFNNHWLNHRRSLGRSSLRSYPRRGGRRAGRGGGSVLPYSNPYWEAPPERQSGNWMFGTWSPFGHHDPLLPKKIPFLTVVELSIPLNICKYTVISFSFHIWPQFVKSLPLHVPEA